MSILSLEVIRVSEVFIRDSSWSGTNASDIPSGQGVNVGTAAFAEYDPPVPPGLQEHQYYVSY